MDICFFSSQPYDIKHFEKVRKEIGFSGEIKFLNPQLNEQTACLAQGCEVVCAFVNDDLGAKVLEQLKELGVKLIAMRCAGFNNVDLKALERLGLELITVPSYSPESVAEHSMALMLALSRKTHKAYQRTRDANFSLNGLVGFCFSGKTVGVIGTGKIGQAMIRILQGFGCKVLAYDPYPSQDVKDMGVEYISLDELYSASDIVTLHCPMTPENHHLLNEESMKKLKDGVMVINTSRGGLIDTQAAIEALKTGKIGSLGLDVYENEQALFFEDKSDEIIQDDIFGRLSACHNVIFTGHQAFLTEEALDSIAKTTLENIQAFAAKESA